MTICSQNSATVRSPASSAQPEPASSGLVDYSDRAEVEFGLRLTRATDRAALALLMIQAGFTCPA